jgi:hypothetical protein
MKKKIISRHNLHQHWYTCPIALPMRRNQQNRSLWLLSQPLPNLVGHHLRISNILKRISRTAVNRFTRQTLPTVNISLSISCALSHFLVKKAQKTLLFDSKPIKYGRHFEHWNKILNMRMSYLDCHEAGLCCYLVIVIENVLRPLQLFYFHLWPIYCLSFAIFWTRRISLCEKWKNEV